MSFSIPTFNLLCNLWDRGSPPPAAPRVSNVPCNLAWGRRISPVFEATSSGCLTLLIPAGTDVRGPQEAVGPDWAEVPAGSKRYYAVALVDDIGKGFPNEHRAALVAAHNFGGASGSWPTPYP